MILSPSTGERGETDCAEFHPDFNVVVVGERECGKSLGLDLHDGQIALLVRADHVTSILLVTEGDFDLGGIFDDMMAGKEVALFGNDKAGAGPFGVLHDTTFRWYVEAESTRYKVVWFVVCFSRPDRKVTEMSLLKLWPFGQVYGAMRPWFSAAAAGTAIRSRSKPVASKSLCSLEHRISVSLLQRARGRPRGLSQSRPEVLCPASHSLTRQVCFHFLVAAIILTMGDDTVSQKCPRMLLGRNRVTWANPWASLERPG